MKSFTVGVNRDGWTQYQVQRDGNHISLTPPDNGMRGWQAGYELELQPDRIDLSTPERQYRIQMSASGVVVDDPSSDGMRGSGYDLVLESPLKAEQFSAAGLAVASSLMGIPLPIPLLEGI